MALPPNSRPYQPDGVRVPPAPRPVAAPPRPSFTPAPYGLVNEVKVPASSQQAPTPPAPPRPSPNLPQAQTQTQGTPAAPPRPVYQPPANPSLPDPRLYTSPTLRAHTAGQAKQLDQTDAQGLAIDTAAQRDLQRQNAAADRAQTAEVKAAADRAKRDENNRREAAFRSAGRPSYVDADGIIQPVHDDATWNKMQEGKAAEEAAKKTAAATADQFTAEGRRFFTSKVTGQPVPLQSDADLAKAKEDRAAKARHAALSQQVTALETSAADPARRTLPEGTKNKLADELTTTEGSLRAAIGTKLRAQSQEVTGGNDYIPFNEAPTPAAGAATERAKAIAAGAELTDADLALLKDDPAVAPQLEKWQNLKTTLAGDAENATWQTSQAEKIFDAKLRRDNPAEWAKRQADRRAKLSPAALQADLAQASTDFQTRANDFQTRHEALSNQQSQFHTQLQALEAQAAQARTKGIAAADLVTFTSPDGREETWPKDLATKREAIVAEAQDWQAQNADVLDQLDAEGKDLQNEQQMLQQAGQQAQEAQKKARTDSLAKLSANPSTRQLGQSLAALDSEEEARRMVLADMYPDGVPPEAEKALADDLQQKRTAALDTAQTQAKRVQEIYQGLNSPENIETTDAGRSVKAGTYAKATQQIATELGLSTAEAKVILDDAEKMDWTQFQNAADQEKTRVLSSGQIILNPSELASEKNAVAAINAAEAKPEDKKAALESLPQVRAAWAQAMLPQFTESGFFLSDFNDWRETRVEKGGKFARLAPEEQLLQYLDELENDSPASKLARHVFSGLMAGTVDIGSQVIGTVGMATGFQPLSELASRINDDSGTINRAAEFDQAGMITRGIGQAARIAPSIGLTMGAGSVVQGWTQAIMKTQIGAKALLGLSVGVGRAKTLEEAIRKIQTAAGLAGGAAGGFVQTAGSQYAEIYGALRAQGMDHATAHKSAQMPAALSGAVTAILTVGFGATGVERLLAPSGKEVVKKSWLSYLKKFGMGAIEELPEEALDEAFSQVVSQLTINPGMSVQTAVDNFLKTLPELALSIGLVGGAGGALAHARDKTAQSPAEIQVGSPGTTSLPLNQRPETLAVVEQAIADFQPQQGSALTQTTLSAAVAVAQGKIETLTTAQLESLGWTRQNGKLTPLKGYQGTPALEFADAAQTKPILRQELLDQIDAEAPGVSGAIALQEADARAAFQDPAPATEATPQPQPQANNGPQSPNSQPTTGSPTTTPAPANNAGTASNASPPTAENAPSKGNEAPSSPSLSGSPLDALTKPAEAERGEQLTNHLTLLGLPQDQAEAVAAHMVRRNGVIGPDYQEQVIHKTFPETLKELGITGALSAVKAKSNPLKAGPDLAERLAANGSPVTAAQTQTSQPGTTNIANIDSLITNGGGTVSVTNNGRKVQFKQFGLAIDGNTAEVVFVEIDPAERGHGFGLAAYEALGKALAAKGIVLQSSKAQYANGRSVWKKLTQKGLATKGAQGVFFFNQQASTESTEIAQARKALSEAQERVQISRDAVPGVVTVDMPAIEARDQAQLRLDSLLSANTSNQAPSSAETPPAKPEETPPTTQNTATAPQNVAPSSLPPESHPLYTSLVRAEAYGHNEAEALVARYLYLREKAGDTSKLEVKRFRQWIAAEETRARGGKLAKAPSTESIPTDAAGTPNTAEKPYQEAKAAVLSLYKDAAAKRRAGLAFGALERAMQRWGKVFSGFQYVESVPTAALGVDGIAVIGTATAPVLAVNLAEYAAQHAWHGHASLISTDTMTEEVGHALAKRLAEKFPEFKDKNLAQLWKDLPAELRNTVWMAYRSRAISKGKTAETAPADLSEQDSAAMSHEFLRMIWQNKRFRGRVTEAMGTDPKGLLPKIVNLLKKLGQVLEDLLGSAPKELRTKIEGMRQKMLDAMDQLEGIAQTPTPAPAPPPSPIADNRRPVVIATSAQPTEGTQDQTTLGSEGVAYTDTNAPISYRWHVADIGDLVISNDDQGQINPNYPQELQPRDRTSAGSEAQVQDIAKNANLDRLSSSSTVGDGAPIIGPDNVTESGNGRAMGIRRAYARGMASASAYKARLIDRAADFGLDPAVIEKMKAPMLVRIRTTEVDRVAFVMAANVGTIAPKREVEQAKIDAKQIVPDLFIGFTPSEDGDIFTAANAGFIRDYIAAVVPPAERPAIIDAEGNLSQTGLRRLRNALFVYAYGMDKATMEALGKLTEDIEADGRNLINGLVALAPRFGEQNSRIEAGALRPLSITQDLAKALATYQHLKATGQTVNNWADQQTLGGIDEGPSELGRVIVRTLDATKRSAKRLMAVLNRYAAAVDRLGDPRQASLFGEEPVPTTAELFALAALEPAAPLAMAQRTDAPQAKPENALKLYRKLKAIEKANGKLDPQQAQTLEKVERSLGQSFFSFAATPAAPADFALQSDTIRAQAPTQAPGQMTLFAAPKTRYESEEYPYLGDPSADWRTAEHPEAKIVNPINPSLSADDKVDALRALSRENAPLVDAVLTDIKKALKIDGKWSFKEPDRIQAKASRPSIRAEKPWHGVEHIRDGLRFKVKMQDFKQSPAIMAILIKHGIKVVKLDTAKMIAPKAWGWRFVAWDLRMPNGQLVEFYAPLPELDDKDVKGPNHHLFEKWRNTPESEYRDSPDYWADLAESRQRYDDAYTRAITRMGYKDEAAAAADWTRLVTSLESLMKAKVSIASTGEGAPRRQDSPGNRRNDPSPGMNTATSPESAFMAIGSEDFTVEDSTDSDGFQGKSGALAMAQRTDSNQQLDLFGLLSPAQQSAKREQAAQLDLFGNLGDTAGNERSRPTSQRPPQSARTPSTKANAPVTTELDDLFANPGMAGTGGTGGTRPGKSGSGGGSGNSSPRGGKTRRPGADTGGKANPQDGTDSDVQDLQGDVGDFDAHTFLRPDLDTPGRNFAAPAGIPSLAPATDKAKILANIEAIRLLRQLETESRNATATEKAKLSSYTGWGAFKEAFNSKYESDIATYWDGKPDHQRRLMPDWLQSWEKNHRALHKLLRENMSEDEFASASASTLNAHYTAAPIIRAMWKMVERLGFTGGRALEPSAGIGHYIGLQPATSADRTDWQTVELDDLSARLLAKLYPESTVNERKGSDGTEGEQSAGRRIDGLGFERARIPNNSVDLVISNVPFHESGPSKKGFPTLNLHNFFFAHAMDKVKPGGIVAFITSESTMQNNMRQRDFLASKGDLVAAFRLPNNAFKANAGTEVTTDIIILRKPDGTPFQGQPWRNLVEVGRQTLTLTQSKDQTIDEFIAEAARTGTILTKDAKPYWKGDKRALDVSAPIMVNEYFVANPQNVLGEHTLASTMYRAGGYAVVAPDSLDVLAKLDALVDTLPTDVMGKQEATSPKDMLLAGHGDKPFSFVEHEGEPYEVQPDGSMIKAEWWQNPDTEEFQAFDPEQAQRVTDRNLADWRSKTEARRKEGKKPTNQPASEVDKYYNMIRVWRSWKRVADIAEELVAAEVSDNFSEEEITKMRRVLNVAYDTHVATHGAISRRFANTHKHLKGDPSYPLTSALENEVVTVHAKSGKKTYSYRKADIFNQRIGKPIVIPTTATNIDDALEKSLAWHGTIDSTYGASLLNLSQAAFEQQALTRPDIFRNPNTGLLEQAEEYLSGNVRVKLEEAQEAANNDPSLKKNVDALIKAQPERKEIARISPGLGARWIPAEVYQAFIKDVLQGTDTVEYIPAGNSWLISGTGLYKTEEHGTERKGPASLFSHALNMTEPLVYDGRSDERTLNPVETAAARSALDKMRRAFIDYVKTSDTQIQIEGKTLPVWEATENAFNETNNSYVTPSHTGAYLTFPGLNTDYVYTKAHRRSVIARFLTTRRGMMAHGVGSGKTFNQIILAQELRRLGLAKKPMIVVQNATLGQFAKSYLKAYPNAKILVPSKSDFQAKNRKRLVAKIATGNWDAVILPHSQFDLISNKESAVKAYMDRQIDELMAIIHGQKDKAKVRDIEGMIKRLKDRRQNLLDALKERQDTAVMWEDLGIDALIMDEAHNYKSLPIITRMGRVKGVPASSDSQRAINFMLKCRDVQSRTGGKNIFLATGTPIKNSMAEAYIMMQFMAPDILEDFHIHNFDDFATAYGQTVTEAEMAWGGTPKMETRFAKFQNGGALVTMIRTMFDVAFGNDKLGLDVPKIKGGEPAMVIVPATESIDQFNAWTRSVDAKWKSPMTTKDEKEAFTAVPIQTMAAGIAAAVDPRLISPNLPDDPGSKVNTAITEVVRIFRAGTDRRTTQIIFSDLRNPFSMDYLMPFTGHPFPDYGSDGQFDLYKDIHAKLIAAGVPEKEIHLMKSGMTDVQKAALFKKVDDGEIRIIVGSTELLGVGVNIQTRLAAVHHLMPPRDFTPAMMEQRNGRIIRQGNFHAAAVEGQPTWNEEVEIINYGTEGSMDSAIYGTLARKQRFITQLLMAENVQDTFDDPTDPIAVNMAEMAARTLGDPDFIRRIELEKEVKELRLLSDAWTNEISGKRSRLARLEKGDSQWFTWKPAPRSRLARLEKGLAVGDGYIEDIRKNIATGKEAWTRTAPPPANVTKRLEATTDPAEKERILEALKERPVFEFGGQTVDTAEGDGIITKKLSDWLLDQSKMAERQGRTHLNTLLTLNGKPFSVRVDLTLPDTPTGGHVDLTGTPINFSYNGAASLLYGLRRLGDPANAEREIQRIQDNIERDKLTIENLRATLEKTGPFPDAAKLASLELEAQEVDARLRAKSTPPEQQSTAAPERVLPPMKDADTNLLTYDVMNVLRNADYIGGKVFIQDQLDRKLYDKVNRALESAGGQWDRRAKAHLFSGDPRPHLGLSSLAAAQKTDASPLDTLQETAMQGYFDLPEVNMAPEKRAPARQAIKAAATASTRRYLQTEAMRDLSTANTAGVRAALDRQTSEGVPFSTILHDFVNRDIPRFDIRGAMINSPVDFAAFNLAIRSPYFESLRIAVLDARSQVIHSQIVHVGSVNESIASPHSIAAIIESARRANPKNPPAGFLIAHNHPSGDPSPSDADVRITRFIQDTADIIGVPLMDHVITNGSRYYSFKESGMIYSQGTPTTPMRSGKPRLPVLERPPLPGEAPLAPWEVISTDRAPSMDRPSVAAPWLSTLLTADPDHHHVVYLDTRLKLRAVDRVPKTAATANILREIVLRAAHEGASSVMIAFSHKGTGTDKFDDSMARLARRLSEGLQNARITVVDAIVSTPENPASFSFRESGMLFAAQKTDSTLPNAANEATISDALAMDPRTAAPSGILSSRLSGEQGQVPGRRIAARLRSALREGTIDPAAPGYPAAIAAAFGVPVLSADRYASLTALKNVGTGVESDVFIDPAAGVVYKVLKTGRNGPSLGIWNDVSVTSELELDWHYRPADRPRHLAVRLAVMNEMGGTPTEIHAIGPAGHVILKQPLSPDAGMEALYDYQDNRRAADQPRWRSALATANAEAGLIPVPAGLLPQDNPAAYVVAVQGRPWLVTDMKPDNYVADNQGAARINDPVIGQITADTVGKVPGLGSVVKAALEAEKRLGDRSARLFAAQKTDANPLARLGWNHADRALSARTAAFARWMNDKTGAGETVARWMNAPNAKPFVNLGKVLQRELFPASVLPREIAASLREMNIKSAMGAQRAMDMVRALSGKPKFSDLAYPAEFQNPTARRDVFMAMTGEKAMHELPPALQTLATRLRAMLVQIGQESVRQGRMSLDTFEGLRENYMPHFYKDDVDTAKNIFKRFALGVKDILAQRTTAWHVVDTSAKDKDGQYRLVSYEGKKWRFKNKEHRDAWFEDFILQESLDGLQARDRKVYGRLTVADLRAPAKLDPETRGRLTEIQARLRTRYSKEKPLTLDQQEKAGLIMDPVYSIARYAAQMVHDNATAEFFNFVAKNPDWVSDTASPGFQQIPDNTRFGRLAGKYVTDDIYRQITELADTPNTALAIYDKLLSWWKTGKTVLNPGTHVRNVLGNLAFSQFAGVSVWNPGNFSYYRDAIRHLRNGGDLLTEAYDSGVLGGDFVSAELRQSLRTLLPDDGTIVDDESARGIMAGLGKSIGQVLPQWAKNPASKAYDKIAALYQAEDEVYKLAAFLKAKSMGMTPAEAADHVRKWFPFYDSAGTSGTIKLAGRTAMPFLSFYRESIRIFGSALKERPLALATALSVPSLLTFLSAMLLGLDDDELDQIKKDMRGKAGKLLGPTPIGGLPIFSMLLPFRSGSGQLQQWDLSAVHPFVDFLGTRVETDKTEDWWQQTWRSMLTAGPIGNLLYSQMTGRDAFGDRPFVEDNMTGTEKAAARLNNAWKNIAPPLAPGGTGWTTIANAGERQTNKTLEMRDPVQAVVRAVGGLDVRNANPDLYRMADDFRRENNLPTSEGMDFSGTTPASRARKALFGLLAQDNPNIAAVANIMKALEAYGSPVQDDKALNQLLRYKNPLYIISGKDNQARFRASLTGPESDVLEAALTEYEAIKARAPAIIAQAKTL